MHAEGLSLYSVRSVFNSVDVFKLPQTGRVGQKGTRILSWKNHRLIMISRRMRNEKNTVTRGENLASTYFLTLFRNL